MGTIHYRQHSIDDLFRENDFEEVAYLLIWGSLPSNAEKMSFRKALAEAMSPPSCVLDVINSFPCVDTQNLHRHVF